LAKVTIKKPTKKPDTETTTLSDDTLTQLDERIEKLEEWLKETGNVKVKKIDSLEISLKKDLAEFVFQTIAIIFTIIALLSAVILGFVTNWDIENKKQIWTIIVLLGGIALLNLVWFVLWLVRSFRKS